MCPLPLLCPGGQDGGAVPQHRERGALGHREGLRLETEPGHVSGVEELESSKLTLSLFSASAQAGLGFEANSALRFGLGAIIIMLIVSTAISVGQKLWPSIKDLIDSNAEGRSLDDVSMTSLAQYAFEAFEKYQALNEERN